MKASNLRTNQQPRLMIIPMIDIVFFLLIFFMMSTLYMIEQKTIPMQLPQAATAKADLEKQIAITVLSNGNVIFEQEEIPAELVQKRITAAIKQNSDRGFVLRADKVTEYRYVVDVIDALKAAGAKRLSLATERKAE